MRKIHARGMLIAALCSVSVAAAAPSVARAGKLTGTQVISGETTGLKVDTDGDGVIDDGEAISFVKPPEE